MPNAPRTHRFRTVLVSGQKRPYTSWAFVVIPSDIATAWGPGPKPVRGTVAGHTFRGTASRGEGVLRVPIPRDFRETAGLGVGDRVLVALQLDEAPRLVRVPDELRAVLRSAPEIGALYDELPPSYRRAWATYVAEAKQPETRVRRADRARVGIRNRAFPR